MPKKLSSTKENDSFIVLLSNFQNILEILRKKYKKRKSKTKKVKKKKKRKINKKKIIPESLINVQINPLNNLRGIQNEPDIEQPKIEIKSSYKNKYSLHFGINEYKNWSILPNALNDTIQLESLFKEKLNFKTKSITNNKVSKQNMEFEILNFKDILDKDDLLVVTFSGHGHSINFDDSIAGFLVPFEANKKPLLSELISMKSLIMWSNWLPAKHIVFIFDCCFSGLSQLRGIHRKSIHSLSHLLDLKCRYVINAGTGIQKVHDGDGLNSPFVTAILKSDVINDGQCSIKDLAADIVHKTSELSGFRQTPISGTLPGDQGGCAFLGL